MASVHLAAGCRPGGLAEGARLGRYEIVSFVARGGMAEVYLARARGIGGFEKMVALKRLAPERGLSAEDTAMFLDEARLAARLEHPNIVQVFDAGERDGVVFLAMEHVDGTDLRALLAAERGRGGALPLGPALAIAIDTAAALHHAHELRAADGRPLHLVHRDVSPSNILVSRTGVVKLADFGIAKAAGHGSVSRAGADKGKASYMAPEQWLGASVDRRADVFALGVVLFEMTTGARPFATGGDGTGGMGALRPSALVPGYPAALEQLLKRALAREPAARHPSAEALRAELEAVARALGLDASTRALATYLQAQAGPSGAKVADPMSPAFVTGTVGLGAAPRRRVRGRPAAALALVGALALAAATWARSEAGAPAARAEPPVEGAGGRAASDSASAAAGGRAASDSDSAAAGGTTAATAAPAAPDTAPAATPAAASAETAPAAAASAETAPAAAASAEAGSPPAPTATRAERARAVPRRRRAARSGDRAAGTDRRRARPAAPDEAADANIPDDLFPGTWRPQ